MTHPTNTPSSQSTVTTSSPLGRQPMRNATPTLQRLLTISTGGLLLSAIAETQAQSADFCQPEAGQLSIECADRSVAPDIASAVTRVGNQPEPDRAFDQDAQPTFSTVATTSQPQASNVMSAPTVDSGVAIAEPAIAKMQPMVTAQASPAPDAVEAASVDSAVENLQKSLNRAGFTVEVNGVFDQETQTALQQFKVQRGLGVTGIAGSPGQTSLISAMPAGYDSGQSLLLVQNTEDESSESAPESEADEDATDTDADATNTPAAEEAEEASEEEASEADDSTETEAATDDTPDAADSGEDAETTDAATPETPDDNLTEEDTEAIADDESDDTAADDAPSETMDTEPTEAEATDSTDESSDAEETDDEPETAPADTEEAPGRDAPADDTPRPGNSVRSRSHPHPGGARR
jgi:peptidoglycan hydrolase-like protein with peptidoglycan-binding domain